MVECELVTYPSFSVFYAVLIDTWWNVNKILKAAVNIVITVLIDTWWNVNDELLLMCSGVSVF